MTMILEKVRARGQRVHVIDRARFPLTRSVPPEPEYLCGRPVSDPGVGARPTDGASISCPECRTAVIGWVLSPGIRGL